MINGLSPCTPQLLTGNNMQIISRNLAAEFEELGCFKDDGDSNIMTDGVTGISDLTMTVSW